MDIKRMIAVDEGYSQKVYICPAGKKTVAYGHNLDADPALHILHRKLNKGDVITQEQAEALYDYDIAKVTANLTSKIEGFNTLPERYKVVLTNMTYNLGLGGVLQFKQMLKAMRAGDDAGVVRSIKGSRYYKQVTNRANRMVKLIEGIVPKEYQS